MYNVCLSGLQNKEGLRQSEKSPPPPPPLTPVPQSSASHAAPFLPTRVTEPHPAPPPPQGTAARSTPALGDHTVPVPRRGAWGHPPVSAVPRAAAGNGKKRWREVGGEGNQKCHFVFFWLILFFFPPPFFYFFVAKRTQTRGEGRSGRCPSPSPG